MCCVTTHAIAPYKVLTLGPFWGVDNFNFPTRVFGESGTWETCVFDARQHGGSLESGIVSCIRLASSGSLSLWVAGVLVVRDAGSLRLLACRRTLGIYLRALARVRTRYILVVRGRLREFLRQLGSRVGY